MDSKVVSLARLGWKREQPFFQPLEKFSARVSKAWKTPPSKSVPRSAATSGAQQVAACRRRDVI